jgi:hypothetical protein
VSARITTVLVALLAAGPLAAQAKPKPAPAARPDSAKPEAAKADSNAAPVLVREVYSYEGGGRDPFLSLLKSGDIRPLLSDLRLVGLYYDGREIVFTVQEFGFERQESLTLAKQEVTP